MNLKKYVRLKTDSNAESMLSENDKLLIQQLVEKYNIKDTKEKDDTKDNKKVKGK